MEPPTSTPITKNSKNLRRRTLMKLVDPAFEVETVNDESERLFRRSFIEKQKQISSPQVAQNTSLNESVQFTGEQEINDHLKICTKLHAENKITSRVAWQLKIIDVLRVMSKKEGSDTLQVASTSLDIGAKVYGIRVDDVHAACLKLANSMARMAGKDQEQEKEENDVNDGDQNEERQKKRKKKLGRIGGPKNTIAKDKNSLLAPLDKLESVFFSTRIDSNLSTVENLFTNRLPMNKSCNKFLVLSRERAWPSGTDEAVQCLERSREFDKTNFPKSGHICIPFQNLILDKWEPEEEHDRSIVPTQNEDVVVYDDQGFPVPELDGTIHDNFNDDNSIHEDEPLEEGFIAHEMQRTVPRIVDIVRPEDVAKSEYSYNSVIKLGNGNVIDQIWAGPSHWKLKFIRRDKVRFTGAQDSQSSKTNKKKMKVEPQPAQWSTEDIPQFLEMLNNSKKIKCKKRINPSSKVTLPFPDSSCTQLVECIHHYMALPGVALVPISSTTDIVENGLASVDERDDAEPEIDDGMDHMDHGVDHDEDIIAQNETCVDQHQNYMGDNLVDAPEYVPKSYVPYALQAKKMNMKKLKTVTWELLTNYSLNEGEKIVPIAFSKLFSALPSALPDSMKKELSCSLAFSALLHLCNEQQLKLIQLPGYKDFMITSDLR